MPRLDLPVVILAASIGSLTLGCSGAAGSANPGDDGGGNGPVAAGDGGTGQEAGSGSGGGSGGSSGSGSGGSSRGGSGSGSGSGGGSGSGSGSGGGSGSGSGGSSGGTSGDGGAVWSPSSSAPIHFHWMIGGFTTADILKNQSGTVVYDIDGEGATAADVAAIHAAGALAVCYVDVGSIEKGRSDYAQFPASVIGPVMQGWPNENWLLVTAANQSIILPLMQARFQNWCKAKGFDAIEPDNLDGWNNVSTIPQADNVAFDLAIGKAAHSLGLSIGLKNVMTDLSASDVPSFLATYDWALNEQCYEYGECGVYTQAGNFIASGKAVFDVEYGTTPNCTQANQDHINAQQTDLNLVGATASGYTYSPCIPDTQTTW